MFYMSHLEEKKGKLLSSSSSIYKNQRNELSHLSKLNSLSPKKRGIRRQKKQSSLLWRRPRRESWFWLRTLNLLFPKHQMMINESLRKPIEPYFLYRDGGGRWDEWERWGLIKRKRGKEARKCGSSSGLSEGKLKIYWGRFDEIAPMILEMLHAKVQRLQRSITSIGQISIHPMSKHVTQLTC